MISFTGRNSTTSSSGAGSFTVEDAIDTANTDALRLAHITTAPTFGAAGMSVGMSMDLEDDAGNLDPCIRIRGEWTDATSGSEDSDIVFEYRRAGAALAGYTRFSPLTGFAMTVDGVGTGTTAGAALYNSTNAALGAQQYSPMLILSGGGWATVGGVSMSARGAVRIRPVQGAAAPTVQFDFMTSINAAAWITGFTLTSGGAGTFVFPGTQLTTARNVALSVENDASVAAIAGAANQQPSGLFRLRGYAYDTGLAAATSVDIAFQCMPTTGNPATCSLEIYKSIGGVAYGASIMSLMSNGTLNLSAGITLSSITHSSNITGSLAGKMFFNAQNVGGQYQIKGNLAAGSALNDVEINSTVARTAGNILQIQNNGGVLGGMSWDGQFSAVTVVSAKGANVGSANDLPLLRDGDLFHVTGVTDIRGLPGSTHATVPRPAGSTVWLIFDGACTVKHNTAPSATWAKILLAGSVDFVTAADSRLCLKYDGTSWYEFDRSVA